MDAQALSALKLAPAITKTSEVLAKHLREKVKEEPGLSAHVLQSWQMMNDSPAIERLGIPAYNWWNECLHGVARAGRATVFPEPIGLAATWDPGLIFRMATAISDEARAKNNEFLRRGKRS